MLPSWRFSRAKSGIFYRHFALEHQARAVLDWLIDRKNIKAWIAYEADLPKRESHALRREREREFSDYKTSFRKPVPAISIALDPNRDRSSGRRTYASYYADVGTQAESRDE
jgi:hypothetical protein